MIALGPVGAVLGRVPVWAWMLAAVLAWGAWHRYQARTEREAFEAAKIAAAAERAASEAAAAAESLRRRRVQQEALDAAHLKTADLERAAAAAAGAAERLRARLAAAQAASCTGGATAAGGGASAGAATDLQADVQRRLDEALRGVARYADAARLAGELCAASYDALKAP